jgi:Ca-activated chloride channel family protein
MILFLCLASAAGAAFRQAPGPAQDANAKAQDQDFRIGVKVELVSLFATVHDSRGKIVTGLSQDDFTVYDNDVRQPISQFSREYMPLSIVILLDTSGSMSGKKLENAKKSLSQFLNRLNSGDEAMLITFDSRPHVVQSFTRDLDRIRRSIRQLDGNGSTALYDAILTGLKESANGRNRRHVLLLLSDGVNTYGRAELQGTIAQLRLSATELFAIGLETDLLEEMQYKTITQSVLDQLTNSAGGESFIVGRTNELGKVCGEISERMHHQYTLAYYPPEARDGRWHTVRIETRIPGYRVVASKTGYFPATTISRQKPLLSTECRIMSGNLPFRTARGMQLALPWKSDVDLLNSILVVLLYLFMGWLLLFLLHRRERSILSDSPRSSQIPGHVGQ